MKQSARILLAVTLALSVAGAFVGRSPELPELPDGRASEPGAGPLGDGLPEIVFLRRFAKERLAREVAAGQRSPLETAGLFRELDQLLPTPDDLLPPPLGAIRITDEERFSRQVIAWVDTVVAEEPRDRADAVLARVETAFREVTRERGAIWLPDPATLEPVEELIARTRATLTAAQQRVLPGASAARR